MESTYVLQSALVINRAEAYEEFQRLANESGWEVLNGANSDAKPKMNYEVFQDCFKMILARVSGQRPMNPTRRYDYSLSRLVIDAAHEYVRSDYYIKEVARIASEREGRFANRPEWVKENERLVEENRHLRTALDQSALAAQYAQCQLGTAVKELPKSTSKRVSENLRDIAQQTRHLIRECHKFVNHNNLPWTQHYNYTEFDNE